MSKVHVAIQGQLGGTGMELHSPKIACRPGAPVCPLRNVAAAGMAITLNCTVAPCFNLGGEIEVGEEGKSCTTRFCSY